jgi:hypothetical protein
MIASLLTVLYVLFFLLCFCGLPLLVLLLIYWLVARQNDWWPFGSRRHPRSEYYIQNQVVLSGPEDVVAQVLREVSGVSLKPLESLRFADLGLGVQACEGLPPDLVVGLYEIEGLFPNVERAVNRLNRSAAGQGGTVQAEPNWLSGHPWDPEGSPWDPEGSPWDPEGSPWDPEGSPAPASDPGPRRKHSVDAQPAWFPEQWAFEKINLAGRPQGSDGSNVVVGIFDTSPFALPFGSKDVFLPGPVPLLASHPFFSAKFKRSKKSLADVRNHGLFAAGLVHHLAPAATLHLVRVLANDNRGDLFTLLREVFNFLREQTRPEAGWQGVVLNLSLGIRIPPAEAGFALPAEVRSLIHLLAAARCLDVVVLAAAGNESTPATPLPPNLPAALPNVVGVAASTDQQRRACYSNVGNLAAPGGEGGPRLDPRTREVAPGRCAPQTAACTGPDCGFGVIGPAVEAPPHSGFIFWVGSSFATPMVSGLAALVAQAGQGSFTAEQIANILYCGAVRHHPEETALGRGVIDVGRTLTECLRELGGYRDAGEQKGSNADQDLKASRRQKKTKDGPTEEQAS